MQQQIHLERSFSKRHLVNELSKDIKVSWMADIIFAIEKYRSKQYSYQSKNTRISKLGDTVDIAIPLIINILRCDGKIVPVQTVISALSKHLGDDLDAVKTAAEIIAVCEGGSLYELLAYNYPDNPTGTLAIEPKVKPSYEVKCVIDRYQYLPPNLVKPLWATNSSGGMLTAPDHCILGKNNKHNKRQNLNTLNILQEIEWVLDPKMLAYEEEPNKELDTPDKVKQFQLLKDTSQYVYNMYKDKKFYFIWKYDKRGRMYSQGYHINLQATDYKKSILSFAKKEVITK